MRAFKRLKIMAILGVLLVSAASAQVDPFMPLNPSTIGKGGSFTADARGYNAFFYNPAGFAEKGEFTLLSANVWAVMDKNLLDMFANVLRGESPIGKGLNSKASVTLPPEFNTLLTALDPYITFLGNAASSNPTGFETALTTFASSHADKLMPGVDVSTLTTADQVLAALDLAAIMENPSQLATLMDDLTGQVASDTSYFTGQPGVTEKADLANAIDNAIAAAASGLPKGNMDLGVMIGMAWAGEGVGIGVFGQGNLVFKTPDMVGDRAGTLLDARGRVFSSITVEAGLGFKLLDDNLLIGVGVRPTLLAFGNISPMGLLSLMNGGGSDPATILNSLMVSGIYKSLYVGVDLGAKLKLGDISIGVAAKDVVPFQMRYVNYGDLDSFVKDLPLKTENGSVVPEGSTEDLYYIPPFKLNAGLAWSPNLGEFEKIFDMTVGVDLFDVFGFIRYIDANNKGVTDPALLTSEYNVLDYIGFGGELKFANFIELRGGFYKRMVTFGLGIQFGPIDVNISSILKNLDLNSYDGKIPGFTEAGVSAEVALRFK